MIDIIGHRGCAGLEPENTIRAFKKAIKIGVDFIEFDVRMTKDKQLVVIHDNKVDRTTNGKGYVKDFTLEEIRKLDAGKSEKMPTFKEVIDLLKNQEPRMAIEIKEPETLNKILEIIQKNKLEKRVLIVSFWHDALKKIKEINPKIETSAIIVGKPVKIVSMIKDANADRISLNYVFIDKDVIDKCHKNNIRVNAWTVDDDTVIENMIKMKVDAIATNYPDKMIKWLRKK